MVHHKEILRLKSLGLKHREIAEGAGCGRNTVTLLVKMDTTSLLIRSI